MKTNIFNDPIMNVIIDIITDFPEIGSTDVELAKRANPKSESTEKLIKKYADIQKNFKRKYKISVFREWDYQNSYIKTSNLIKKLINFELSPHECATLIQGSFNENNFSENKDYLRYYNDYSKLKNDNTEIEYKKLLSKDLALVAAIRKEVKPFITNYFIEESDKKEIFFTLHTLQGAQLKNTIVFKDTKDGISVIGWKPGEGKEKGGILVESIWPTDENEKSKHLHMTSDEFK